MKLGVNLTKQEESGNFVFVDCLTHLLGGRDVSKLNDSGSSPSTNKMDEVVKKDSSSTIVFSLSRLKHKIP